MKDVDLVHEVPDCETNAVVLTSLTPTKNKIIEVIQTGLKIEFSFLDAPHPHYITRGRSDLHTDSEIVDKSKLWRHLD